MDENQVKQSMQKVLELIVKDVGTIRTGRATSDLVANIKVLVYKGSQKLHIVELASISTPDSQTIIISPWDKAIIGEIKKGIEVANTGLNPVIDGEIIRLTLSPLTSEDRQKYIKILSGKIENGRIMIRQIRSEVMREIKKTFENRASEDEKFQQEKKLQELTDEYIEKIQVCGHIKESELKSI